MADNFLFTPGTGATGGSDDIGGVHYPRYKLIHGIDGTNDGDISRANGLPTAPARVVAVEDLITIAYTTPTTSFASCVLLNITTSTEVEIWNDTDANMLFNWDNGANSDFIVPARCARTVRILAGATQLYIKRASTPTVGNIYLEVTKG